MGNHFDDNLAVIAGAEDAVDGGNLLRETGVHNAAAHGLNRPQIGCRIGQVT